MTAPVGLKRPTIPELYISFLEVSLKHLFLSYNRVKRKARPLQMSGEEPLADGLDAHSWALNVY